MPGRYRGELERLSAHFGVPFVRGPDEIADLPAFLGRAGVPPDLSRHDMRIFAEIVDAPMLSIAALLARARSLARAGADVIDLGCLPETPFPLLGEAVRELKAEGLCVSVDSAGVDELMIGARAGADYLLSLDENTLPLAFDHQATPVLIPSIPAISIRSGAPSRSPRAPASSSSPIPSSIRSISVSPARSAASSRRGGAGRRSNC